MTAATSKRRSLERRTPKHNPAWPNWASGYFATLPAPLPVRRPGFLILRALFNLKRSCLTYLNPLKRVQVNRSTPAMPPCQAHFPQHHDRRQFLLKAGGGIGGLALAGLLQQDAQAAKPSDSRTKPRTKPASIESPRTAKNSASIQVNAIVKLLLEQAALAR